MSGYSIVAASRQIAAQQRHIAQENDPALACRIADKHTAANPQECCFVFWHITPNTKLLHYHTLNP